MNALPVPTAEYNGALADLSAMSSAWDRMTDAALARDDVSYQHAKTEFWRLNGKLEQVRERNSSNAG